MLGLSMIQERAEQMMARHHQITVKAYLEDSWAADRAGRLVAQPVIEPHFWSHLAEIH